MAASITDTYIFLERKSSRDGDLGNRLQFGLEVDGTEGQTAAAWGFTDPNISDSDPFQLTEFRSIGPKGAPDLDRLFGEQIYDRNLIERIASNEIELQVSDFGGTDTQTIQAPFSPDPDYLPLVDNMQATLEGEREVSWSNPAGPNELDNAGVDTIQVRVINNGENFDTVFQKSFDDLTTESVSFPDFFPRTNQGEELVLRVELMDLPDQAPSSQTGGTALSSQISRSTFEKELIATADAPGSEPGAAGRTFLNSNASVTVSDALEVLGRAGGDETVRLIGSAENVLVDGNIENVQLPGIMSATSLEVVDGQLEIRTDDKSTMAFSGGLNQDVMLEFANGEGTLEQTGATSFTFEGPAGAIEIGAEAVTAMGVTGTDADVI